MLRLNRRHKFHDRHRFLLAGILCLLAVCFLVAQDKKPQHDKKPQQEEKAEPEKPTGNEGTRVDLLHADREQANELVRPDIQVLIGSIELRHDSMYMYCDSALVYEKTSSFEAFSNMHMEQGDTLFIYGDYLSYDGMTQIAQLCENVKMINRSTTLLTDSLNYDRLYNLGYYSDGDMLMGEENVLTSGWGEYNPVTKLSVFNRDVKFVNPRLVLTFDTLKYSTNIKIAIIPGPSNIASDQNHIYSERGIYSTVSGQAELLDHSVLTNEGKRLIDGNPFYDHKADCGEAFDNVQINDTVNKSMLTGDCCYYNELKQNVLATKRAVATDCSRGDSLFMHTDTLLMNSHNLDIGPLFREIRVFHKVRMYSADLQGVCGSLIFNMKDSCPAMYRDPIIWNEGQQLLEEEVKVYMNDDTIDWACIINWIPTVEQKDPIHFNQISGKEVKAYFAESEAREIGVIGNVLVVYYPQEQDSTMIGMNTSETSLLNMYLKDRKMQKMVMSPESNRTLYPTGQTPPDKMELPTFSWFDCVRPLNKEDIFNWRGKEADGASRKTERRVINGPKRKIVNVK